MSKLVICVDDGSGRVSHVWLPPEAAAVIRWQLEERAHQVAKFDFGPLDVEHALEGLGPGSWFWERGVVNYAHRVGQLGGITEYLGMQACLKIITTVASIPEHLLRAGIFTELPSPGPSGSMRVRPGVPDAQA